MTIDRIKAMPKGEFHLHIEGAIPYKFIQERYPEKYESVPESWAEDFRYPDFPTFDSQLLGLAGEYLKSAEDYYTAAQSVFQDCLDNNVRYLETSMASGVVEFFGIPGREICKALRAAKPDGLELRVFMGIHHNGYNENTSSFIEESLSWPELDGYDLHGMETEPLGDWADDFWKRAQAAGRCTKAHAGEFDGPDFIRRMVSDLGVTRIQHGVRAIEDPELVELLVKENVTLDICPISNLKLQVVPSLKEHPVKPLMEAGVRCTISRDDPLCFGNTLTAEYSQLQKETGLDDFQIRQLVSFGFDAALTDSGQKNIWKSELDSFFS